MTSILTNSSAMSVLRTLRLIGGRLDDESQRLSSGLRVKSAVDDAAYWSISTTMRSDVKAISAAGDAIGLGEAKLDIAYAGMTAAVDALSTVKALIVSASEPGVDRNKVQREIDSLKKHVLGIASSASFSGENWLSTSVPDIYTNEAIRSMVSSFVRNGTGGVSLETIDLSLAGISLFNSTGGGILQPDLRSAGDIGGLRGKADTQSAGQHSYVVDFDGPLIFGSAAAAITFNITVDGDNPATTPSPQPGTTISVSIDRSVVDAYLPGNGGVISNVTEWAIVLQGAIGSPGVLVSGEEGRNKTWISTRETLGRGASIKVTDVTSTIAGGKTGGLGTYPFSGAYGSRAQIQFPFSGGFLVHETNEIKTNVSVNGNDYQLTLTHDMVNTVLGRTDGRVDSADDMALLLETALDDQNAGVLVESFGGTLFFKPDPSVHPEASSRSQLSVGPFDDLLGYRNTKSLMEIDISAGGVDLGSELTQVEFMLASSISAASKLGATSTRLRMQSEFAKVLMSTIDKGVGRLVDADMEDTAVKHKALETQRQLTIQALGIANSEPGRILELFR